MRGWSTNSQRLGKYKLVLPAHAGVILLQEVEGIGTEGITRTCGGDPTPSTPFFCIFKYYPHMRGWSWEDLGTFYTWEVLPAHAGVIPSNWSCQLRYTSITRTCGGDPTMLMSPSNSSRYYPHMRGWSQLLQNQLSELMVLPAHAGVILSVMSKMTG